MNKYKTTLTNEMCGNIEKAIEFLFEDGSQVDSLSAMIAIAALGEVVLLLRKKQVEYKRDYKVSFSIVQALSLCYLYNRVDGSDVSPHFLNRLHQINSEVLQQFTL